MRNLRLPVLVVAGLAVLYLIFFNFCKHSLPLGTASPFGEDPYDAVGSFGIQLALLATFLMLIRVFRPYSPTCNLSIQKSLIQRAGTVVLLCVGLTLGADLIGLIRDMIVNGTSQVTLRLAGLTGGMVAVTFAAWWIFRIGLPYSRELSTRSPWRRAMVISALAVFILAIPPWHGEIQVCLARCSPH